MDKLIDRIEMEKERYFDFIKKNNDKKIYIYGAGKQGRAVAEFLTANRIDFKSFCVTNIEDNRKKEFGVDVVSIEDILDDPNEVAFIIGVRNQLNREIIDILLKKGFYNYLESSSYVRYLGGYGLYSYRNPLLEITTQIGCSVNCKYCPQGKFIHEYLKKTDSVKTMTLEMFKKCLDKIPKETIVEFAGFTEPFLNEDCISMIEYAVEKGFKINIFTTLCGLTPNLAKKLTNYQFEEFVLHLPDENGYANIVVDEQYMECLHILLNAKKRNGECFVDYASAQGSISNEIRNQIGDNTRVYVVLNNRAGNLKDESLYQTKEIHGAIRCELSEDINHNILLPDGRVVLCANDWGMKHVLGNLRDDSYDDIVNSREANFIRKAMLDEKSGDILCRHCFQALEKEKY